MKTAEESAWHLVAPPNVTTRVVDVGRARIFALLAGEGSTPIVFISGLGDATVTWVSVLPELARTCRVIAYDRPGMGASPAIDGTRSLEVMALELAGLIESLQEGPAVLVGHSLGGLIAAEAYRCRRDLVAGLVLVDSADPAILEKRGLVAIQRFSIWLPRALAAIGLWPRIARSVARREASVAVHDPQAQEAVAGALLENLLSAAARRTSAAELRGLVMGARSTFNAVSPSPIDVPIVVMSATSGNLGKKMRAAWTEHQRLVATASPTGRHLEVSGGHYLHRERPSAVIEEVLSVLRSVRERQLDN